MPLKFIDKQIETQHPATMQMLETVIADLITQEPDGDKIDRNDYGIISRRTLDAAGEECYEIRFSVNGRSAKAMEHVVQNVSALMPGIEFYPSEYAVAGCSLVGLSPKHLLANLQGMGKRLPELQDIMSPEAFAKATALAQKAGDIFYV